MADPNQPVEDIFGDTEPAAGPPPSPAMPAPPAGPTPAAPVPAAPTPPPPPSPTRPVEILGMDNQPITRPESVPGTDILLTPPAPAPAAEEALDLDEEDEGEEPRGRRIGRGSRIRLIVLIVAVVLGIGALAFAYYYPRLRGTAPAPSENINQVAPVETPNLNQPPVNEPTITPIQPVADADGDGLTDEQEQALGTDPNAIDTDQDGLTDRQETEIYQTDPLDKDSDGDSFEDGEEVRSFYDPNGPGKLLDVTDVIQDAENQPEESQPTETP